MTGIKKQVHTPVLLQESLNALEIKSGHWYVDATIGFGGHSGEILKLGGKVLGIDQDKQALNFVNSNFAKEIEDKNLVLYHGNFRTLSQAIEQIDQKPSGILFDLGMSSFQLDESGRGFSFQKSEELDMRMDPQNQAVKARDLINGLYEKELEQMIATYGEDPLSRVIAKQIVYHRKQKPIENTGELVQILRDVYKHHYRSISSTNPATKTFQALRIAVNDEMHSLKEGLDAARQILAQKGIVAVITFHGLEDKLVKKTFLDWQQQNLGEVKTKKPIYPSELEIKQNSRSHSAKLRVFKKI